MASQKNLTPGFSELGNAGGLPQEDLNRGSAWAGGGARGSQKGERKVGMRRDSRVGPYSLAGGLSGPGPSGSAFSLQPEPAELTPGPQFVQHHSQSTFSAPALTWRHQIAVSVPDQGAQAPIPILTQLSWEGQEREERGEGRD